MLDNLFDTLQQQSSSQIQTPHERLPRTCADGLTIPEFSRKEGYPVGLKNQGATCYLNSLLQILFHTPELRKTILSLPLCQNNPCQKTKFLNENKHKFMLGFQRLFSEMTLKDNYGLATDYLNESFGWEGTEHIVQHDIQQAMKIIFDTFERALMGTQYQKNIRDLFKGISTRYKSCKRCSAVEQKIQQFYGLNLQVQNFQQLQQSVMSLLIVEAMEGENKIFCQTCQSKQDMWLGNKFKVLPNVLVFTLTRFTFDYDKFDRIKLNNYFSFNLQYNFTYLIEDPGQKQCEYQLYGVLIHRGSAHSGHYLCYIRDLMQQSDWKKGLQQTEKQQLSRRQKQQKQKQVNLTKQQKKRKENKAKEEKCYDLVEPQNKQLLQNWFQLNDSKVVAIDAKKITSKYEGAQSAYILFYRKKGIPIPNDIKVPQYYAKIIRTENQILKKQREEYEIKKNQITLKIDGNQETLANSTKISDLVAVYCPFGYALVNETMRNDLVYYPLQITSQQQYKQTDTVKSMDLINESVWKKLEIGGSEYQKIKHLISVTKIPFLINVLLNETKSKIILYEDQCLSNLKKQIQQVYDIAWEDQIIKLVTPFKQYFVTDSPQNDSVLLTKLGFAHGYQIVIKKIQNNEKQQTKVVQQQQLNKDCIKLIIERDDIYGIKKMHFDKNKTLQELLNFIIENQQLPKYIQRRLRNLNNDHLFDNEQYKKQLDKLGFGEEVVKLRIERGEIPMKTNICVIAKMQSKFQNQSCPPEIEGIFDPNMTVLEVKKKICEMVNLKPQLHRLYQTDWMGQPSKCINKQKQSIYDAKFGREEKVCLRDVESPIGTELKVFEVFETKIGTPEDLQSSPITIIKIAEHKTISDLKYALLASQLFKNRQVVPIQNIRMREMQRDYMLGQIFRDSSKQLTNYNFNTNKLVVQVLEKGQNLNENQIVLVLKKRNRIKRIYEGHEELVFNAGRSPSISDLQKAVVKKLGFDQGEQIKLVKYVHYDFIWIEISNKHIEKYLKDKKDAQDKAKKQPKSKNPKGKSNKNKNKQQKKTEEKKQVKELTEQKVKDAGAESLHQEEHQLLDDHDNHEQNQNQMQVGQQNQKKNQKIQQKDQQKLEKKKDGNLSMQKGEQNAIHSKPQIDTVNKKKKQCEKKQDCYNLRKLPFMLKDGNWIGYAKLDEVIGDDLQTDEDLSLRVIKKNGKAIAGKVRGQEKAFKVNIDF